MPYSIDRELDDAARKAHRRIRREEKARERREHEARMEAIHEESRTIVATGRCPDCDSGLHRNYSLTGWWQCDRYGTLDFRHDKTGPSCSFQCFTE